MPDYQNHSDIREGTAQPQRLQAALSPEYFQLEERNLGDWIAIARNLAKYLRYFDFDNRESGNWSTFLGEEWQRPVAEIQAFLDNPEHFIHDPQKQSWLSRPHFILFLSFLELLELEKQEINRFTQRHLDYFYRQVLGIASKAALPDMVHLVFEPARGVREQRIEAGAKVLAGQTPEGKTRYLHTQEEIVVNRAKVAEVKVFFQERKVLGLEEVYQNYIKKNPGDTKGAIGELLLLVLPSKSNSPEMDTLFTELVSKKNWPFLFKKIKPLLNFSKENLGLSLFELRRLRALTTKQRNPKNKDWILFNEYLLKAGKERFKSNPNLIQQLSLSPHDAFEMNFQKAMGFAWDTEREIYNRIQGINNLFELFDLLRDLDKQWYDDLVKKHFFLSTEDFCRMMEAFDKIRRDWRGINRFLDKIRTINAPAFVGDWKEWPDFIPVNLSDYATDWTFQQRLSNILVQNTQFGGYPGIFADHQPDFNTYYWEIENTERFFNLSAEEILFIVGQIETGTLTELPRLFQLLEKAYQSRQITEKTTTFESRYRLKSSSAAAIHNRYKLLEEKFGLRDSAGKYFVLPPYPPTETRAQNTGVMLQSLYNHWSGNNPSNKAQARRYLENTFHLRVEEMDDFLGFLRYFNPDFTMVENRNAWNNYYNEVGRDWNNFYRLVARAAFRREDVPARSVQEQHLGFFAAPDATLLRSDGPEESHARWRTFGPVNEKLEDNLKTPDAQLGLVIESPLLEMKGGTRKITLDFHAADIASVLAKDFHFFISVADEKEPFFQIFPAKTAANPTEITLTLMPEAPAVVRPTDTVLGPLVAAPVLKIVRKEKAEDYPEKSLSIKKISLSVNVDELVPDAAWNDEGEVNPQRPFEPFGSHPRVGSRFTFTHAELRQKKISDITFKFEWMGKPNEIESHYENYIWDIPEVELLDTSVTTQKFAIVEANKAENDIKFSNLKSTSAKYTLELLGNFGHDQYLLRVSESKIETNNITNTTTVTRPLLKAPYTPKLKSLKITYTANTDIEVSDKKPPHRAWQLHPFGIAMPAGEEKLRLVPELPYEAELYIGLEDISPGQSVNILFQVAEGSADPEQTRRPVTWQYLSAAGWRSAAEHTAQPLLLDDPTDHLSRSGVLRFHLPTDADSANPLLPMGRYWLRAAIAEQRGSVCDIIGLHTQAVAALRVLDTGSDDPGVALSPGTAKGLQQRLPGIKALSQPYSSFGGRSPEGDADYYRRCAERLRHKQRALSLHDIERLLLEEYPELYRVKCLPAMDTPGTVEVVALPDQRGRLPQDPLQPRLPQATLDRMAAWLQSLGPQPAHYRLRNARFLPLKVQARLRLRPGYDEAYYLRQLIEELTRYLSPWAYDDNADIRFGGTVYVGQILNFIEERPCVDHITQLSLHWQDMDGKWDTATESVTAPRPDIVWVSAPTHDLKTAESFVPDRPRRGIGEMAVEIDLIIA